MERLTMRNDTGIAFWADPRCAGGGYRPENRKDQERLDRLAAYEDFMERWRLRGLEEAGRIFQRVNALGGTDLMAQYRDLGPIGHLQELAQAEKDGRLVVLPFCVGSSLYEATGKGVREYETEQFSIGSEDLFIHALDKVIWYRGGRIFGLDQIGKTVFLTREEAEAALKKREEEAQ